MEFLRQLYTLFRHLDPQHLIAFCRYCGAWVYVVMFAIIFCETGLVVAPFLPGDSLLFAIGAVAALDDSLLNIWGIFALLATAAVLGNTTNYHIGRWMGPKALHHDSRFLKKKYLDQTHAFFERYGGMTIVLSRFVPIVRTFAPFVSGVGQMNILRFQSYNILGGGSWVGLLVFAGYFFGKREVVQKNFSLVIAAIVIISILPGVIGYLRTRIAGKAAP